MNETNVRRIGGMLVLVAGLYGCGQSPQPAIPAAGDVTSASNAGHSHAGWWCDEHGVPEEICALCNAKVAADFKAKEDWCKEHDRPESQCFICHPEREAEFAALYEAKYGEQPPEPHGDVGPKHDEHRNSHADQS
jgi:hypothetical protein